MKRNYRPCKTKKLRAELAKKQKNGHAFYLLLDLFFEIVKQAENCDCGYKACMIYTHPDFVKKIK